MNAGFSNLDYLKKQLLAPALRATLTYDDQLVALGLGVVGMFERFCNRDFTYAAGVQEITQGDRSFWFTRRTPVTQFTNVELRFFTADTWTSIMGQPLASDEEKGLIHFGYTLGRAPMQVRITYNGGYIWEQLEPSDPGFPSLIPSDITNNAAGLNPLKFNLPAELLYAWVLQCKHIWQTIDPRGVKIVGEGDKNRVVPQQVFGDMDMIPQVLGILKPFIRYQIT
jgi:hypothetical protein